MRLQPKETPTARSPAEGGRVARTIDRVKGSSIVLVVLALVAAVIGYAVAYAVISALPLPAGLAQLAVLFVPVFIAGLCMIPFVAPLLDRMAKRDLEAHRAAQAAANRNPQDPEPPAS
jgi:uncharacterized membrane protein YedE/YeeE